jgi:hypothetical protein
LPYNAGLGEKKSKMPKCQNKYHNLPNINNFIATKVIN